MNSQLIFSAGDDMIVYKTTNKKNGKYYIGVHNEKDAKYLGTGKAIMRAVKKYGRECFERETLFKTDDIDMAYLMESELVTNVEVNSLECYNLKNGGFGGRTNRPDSEKTRAKKKKSFKESDLHAAHLKNVGKHTRKLRSELMKKRIIEGWENPMQNEESRKKVSLSKIGTKALWKDGEMKMAVPGSQKWIELEALGFEGRKVT